MNDNINIVFNSDNLTLISNMDGYFGFGGSAVKGIGRETIKAGTSIL